MTSWHGYTDIRYSDITPCIDWSVAEPGNGALMIPNELGRRAVTLLT